MDLKHFIERGQGSGDLANEKLTERQFRKLLTNRINSIDLEKVKADAVRFIPDGTRLDIWSKRYFNDLSAHLKTE
jgi:hypothetical protein